MFTGIVQHVGRITGVSSTPGGVTLTVETPGWNHQPIEGESIAVNGCCLTATGIETANTDSTVIRFDVITQTLNLTTVGALSVGDAVNLEHAVTPVTMLGGHIVQGHVDGVGEVVHVDQTAQEHRVRIAPPSVLLDMLISQGSIAVDGVSLTIATADDSGFEVALIPQTLRATTLGTLRKGSRVNLEVDYIARIVVHWLERQQRTHRADALSVD